MGRRTAGAFAVRAPWRTANEASRGHAVPLTAEADDVTAAPSPPGRGARMLAGWQSLGPPKSHQRWAAEAAALAENSFPPLTAIASAIQRWPQRHPMIRSIT